MATRLSELRQAAVALHREGATDRAVIAYAEYLALKPDDAGIWSNLGVIHRRAGRFEMALRTQRKAHLLAPEDRNVQTNLANILSDIGRYDESLFLREALLAGRPADAGQAAMIGRCLRGKGDYDAAIAWLQRQADSHRDDAEIQMQLAFALLGRGDYADGFRHYKARWRGGELAPRDMPIPEWQGEDLAGKTLVVLPEQGFGDAILFARFLPILKGYGGRVRFVCEKPTARIFAGLAGADAVVPGYRKGDPGDYWINMMDLALLHFEQQDAIPPPADLSVPEDSAERARQLTAPHEDAFRIGVVWTGSLTYKGNAFRSLSHTDLLPLADLPGVRLFSLYKGPARAAYLADGSSAFMLDAGGTERDFADCAAMMQRMDLIVTSDTATAHLAGSLGCETAVLLHWDPFWVYGHAGDTTAWYPAMRLYRQSQPLVWDDVIAAVMRDVSDRLEP